MMSESATQKAKAIAEKLISNWFSFIKCCCWWRGNDKSFFMYHIDFHIFCCSTHSRSISSLVVLCLMYAIPSHFFPVVNCVRWEICFSLYYLMLFSPLLLHLETKLFFPVSLVGGDDWAMRISDGTFLMFDGDEEIVFSCRTSRMKKRNRKKEVGKFFSLVV